MQEILEAFVRPTGIFNNKDCRQEKKRKIQQI